MTFELIIHWRLLALVTKSLLTSEKKIFLTIFKLWLLDGGLALLQYLIFPMHRGLPTIPISLLVGIILHMDVIGHADKDFIIPGLLRWIEDVLETVTNKAGC